MPLVTPRVLDNTYVQLWEGTPARPAGSEYVKLKLNQSEYLVYSRKVDLALEDSTPTTTTTCLTIRDDYNLSQYTQGPPEGG